MKPLRVTATNYGPYEHVVWEIPSGLTAVLGRNGSGEGISSNGAGKTKLLEIMPIALFGPRLPWSEYVTLGTVEQTCTVELEFEHADATYKVRRSFNPKGRGKTTFDLERFLDSDPEDNWVSLTRESQTETQNVLNVLLGLSEATFSQSVFAAQGAQHFADPALTPAQRKAVLSEALGLDLWDRLRALVAADRQQAELELREAELRRGSYATAEQVAEAEQALALDRVAAAELEQQIADLERGLEDQRRSLDAAREAAAARREAEARRDTAKAEFARLHDLAEQAQNADQESAKLLPLIEEETRLAATVPEIEQKLEEAAVVDATLLERKRLLAQGQEANSQAVGFRVRLDEVAVRLGETEREIAATCDRCGQSLTDSARETMANSLRADLTVLETERERLDAVAAEMLARADAITVPAETWDVQHLRALLMGAREASSTLARLEARYEAFGAVMARVSDETFTGAYALAKDALLAAETALRDMPELPAAMPTGEYAAWESELRLRRDQHTLLVSSRGAGEEKLRALTESLAAATEHEANMQYLHERLDGLRYMERMYGRDGIPALLLESIAVPQIESEAQRVLQALGTDLRVELRTQRALKSDDRLKDTLDVVVVEPNGERSYASFSGGERSRVNIALRIGLARLIASRKGTDVKVFCADEVEYLDEAGLRRLPEVLRGLTEFESVIAVHHNEAFLDGFDHAVTVVRDGDRSTIEA